MTGEPYLVTTKLHMSYVIELHALCFGSDEQTKLTYALLDKNCFSFLGGCDEDGKPTGYCVARVQGKSSTGLWFGVRSDREHLKRNRFRKKGLGRALMMAGFNEARARGAEYGDTYVSNDNPTSDITISMHKEMGFDFVKSFSDTYINDDGERVEFVNHHFRKSLMPIANLSLTLSHSFQLSVCVKHLTYISIELSENLSTLTAKPTFVSKSLLSLIKFSIWSLTFFNCSIVVSY